MTPKEKEKNIKRINNLDFQSIIRLSTEYIARLTSDYSESLVRKLIARGKSLSQQFEILRHVKSNYEYWQKNTVGISGPFDFPEFIKEIQLDLKCGLMITGEDETETSEESIEEYMAKHAMTKEDLDKAISDYKNKKETDEKHSETTAALEARIKELEAEIEKLKSENKELKEQLTQKPTAVENTEAMNSLKDENERFRKEHEEMIVELLKPIFYNSEQDVKEFLKKNKGRQDTEIIDTVCEFLNGRKISDKSKGRSLWKILHAAKYYSSTESNWNTALRNHL